MYREVTTQRLISCGANKPTSTNMARVCTWALRAQVYSKFTKLCLRTGGLEPTLPNELTGSEIIVRYKTRLNLDPRFNIQMQNDSRFIFWLVLSLKGMQLIKWVMNNISLVHFYHIPNNSKFSPVLLCQLSFKLGT